MNKRITVRTFTKADKAAHRRLREVWEDRKKAKRFTQQTAADAWGVTQGLVTQYLNGIIPLGDLALIRFARFLNVQPTDIRPDFKYGQFSASELNQEAIDFAVAWMSLPPALRDDVKRMVTTMQDTGYTEYLDNVINTQNSEPQKANSK